jgi:hypothetical protein
MDFIRAIFKIRLTDWLVTKLPLMVRAVVFSLFSNIYYENPELKY